MTDHAIKMPVLSDNILVISYSEAIVYYNYKTKYIYW